MSMEPLEVFRVWSAVKEEADVYHDIIGDVMSDLRLASAIGRINVEIYPSKSLFMMTAILRDVEMPIRVSDMATVDTTFESGEMYVRVTIDREKYMTELTRYLSETYTPANVIQTDRWTILIRAKNPEADAEKIPKHIITNPSQTLHADMIEFSVRAVPEGFRVRYHTFENNEFLFVASEDIIEMHQLEHAQKMMDKLKTMDADPKSATSEDESMRGNGRRNSAQRGQ